MNNKDLFDLFLEISTIENSFDRYIALKQNKKQYKQSDFYKTTHIPLRKAYAWFIQDGISHLITKIKYKLTAERLGEYLTNVLDNISPDAVEQLINRLIESLNTTELISSSKELGDILQSFKH